MAKLVPVVALVLVVARQVAAATESATTSTSLDECLDKDSISCLQRSLFRRAKEFFDRDSLPIFGGVSLIRKAPGSARSARSLLYEVEVDKAPGVLERQAALEGFLVHEIRDFMAGPTFKINFTPALDKISQTARSATEFVPTEIKEAADEIVEGRGKKKLLKHAMPLLAAAKMKFGILATLGYFVIAVIAKKAILASLASLAISSFFGLRGLWSGKSSGGHDGAYSGSVNAPVISSSSSWSAPVATSGWSAASGWDDIHGAYSEQSPAYVRSTGSSYHLPKV